MEASYQVLKSGWLAGNRDRDLSLQLMFYAWMHWADPPFVTGLSEDPDAEQLWREVFDAMAGDASADAEFLFVAGLVAEIFPHVLGDAREWAARGSDMKKRAMRVEASPLPLGTFDNRGEYGKYFSHQLRRHLRHR